MYLLDSLGRALIRDYRLYLTLTMSRFSAKRYEVSYKEARQMEYAS